MAEKQQGARVVKDLVTGLHGSGKNVTTDNFFTSHSLGHYLLTKQLTLLGTVRKNRRELPPVLLPKNRPEHDSIFAFTADTMLVSYAPKSNRSVVLLSTMHEQADIDEVSEAKKPAMVLDYNATKGAVMLLISRHHTAHVHARIDVGLCGFSFSLLTHLVSMHMCCGA